MKNFVRQVWSEHYFVLGFAIFLLFVYVGVNMFNSINNDMSGKPIPNDVTIIYKQTERRGALNILRYEAFDANNTMYFITQSDFASLKVPQLTDKGIFIMPDGSIAINKTGVCP